MVMQNEMRGDFKTSATIATMAGRTLRVRRIAVFRRGTPLATLLRNARFARGI